MGTGKAERSALKRRLPLFSLLGANGVSQVGNMAATLAIPWFVLETTGSAAQTGLSASVLFVGAVLPPALGGPLADRMGFKRTSVVFDIFAAVAAVAIPALHFTGLLAFWHLLLLVFIVSSCNGQGDSGRLALTPALAELAGMHLERANAAERSVNRFGQFAGPVLAGILIPLVGASNVLVLDAATFVVSAFLVALGVPSTSPVVEIEQAEPRGYLSDLMEGLRFIWNHRLIRWMLFIVAWGNLLLIPLVVVVLPVYAQTYWGSAAGVGAVLGTFGAGALTGTLVFGVSGRNWPKRATFLTGFILAPLLAFGALAATAPLPVIVLAAALAGIIAGPINPIILTVIQENTPPSILGRVFGAVAAVAYIGVPIGSVLTGYAIEAVTAIPTVVAMGAAYLAATSSMLFNPAFEGMDHHPTEDRR